MVRFLEFLWSGCWHDWEVVKEGKLNVYWYDSVYSTGRYRDLSCSKCKRMKSIYDRGKGHD